MSHRSGLHAAFVVFLPAFVALCLSGRPAHAQVPAALYGRVLDIDGRPVSGARVELVESGEATLTDEVGAYAFRALSGGRHMLRVTRIDYREHTVTVDLPGGQRTLVDVHVVPAPVTVTGLDVVSSPSPVAGTVLDRQDIERSGARQAGDIVRQVPGVVVSSTVRGGPATVSIRGSAPDAVLVLVDGVAINDPVMGVADMSVIPSDAIQAVTVIPGARSARYGPRAEAGVILIETRRNALNRVIEGSWGSLGARSASATWGGTAPLASLGWSAGVSADVVTGAYEFDLPSEVGGGRRRRENADARNRSGWLALSARLAGGMLRIRGSAASTDRGLPGKGYAPSRHAREHEGRSQAGVIWSLSGREVSARLAADAARRTSRFADPAPPAGFAYDDTSQVTTLGFQAEVSVSDPGSAGRRFGAGVEARRQRVGTSLLSSSAPTQRLDAGIFAHAGDGVAFAGGTLAATGEARADRDPGEDRWRLNRTLTVSWTDGTLQTYLAWRSSFSPPSLGDQFFRDAVGVEPNPDLRGERVPSEIELAAHATGRVLDLRASLGLTVHRANVRDMIVWAPDYRFIWSPRNVDVKRLGAETEASIESLDGEVRLTASHAYARVTYDRPGPDDTVQVLYRPRHIAALSTEWNGPRSRVEIQARYTGTRYPVPAAVNALPGFWTASAAVSRDLHVGRWTVTPTLRTDRLFDQKASLIFGFPEPGRELRLDIALRAPSP